MDATKTIPSVLTADDVAVALFTSARHVRRLAREGRLAYLQLPGGEIGFLPEDVAAYLKTLRRAPAVQPAGGPCDAVA
jgi:excisionase family DNA binding protein